jgi:hypothetical protein
MTMATMALRIPLTLALIDSSRWVGGSAGPAAPGGAAGCLRPRSAIRLGDSSLTFAAPAQSPPDAKNIVTQLSSVLS